MIPMRKIYLVLIRNNPKDYGGPWGKVQSLCSLVHSAGVRKSVQQRCTVYIGDSKFACLFIYGKGTNVTLHLLRESQTWCVVFWGSPT